MEQFPFKIHKKNASGTGKKFCTNSLNEKANIELKSVCPWFSAECILCELLLLLKQGPKILCAISITDVMYVIKNTEVKYVSKKLQTLTIYPLLPVSHTVLHMGKYCHCEENWFQDFDSVHVLSPSEKVVFEMQCLYFTYRCVP